MNKWIITGIIAIALATIGGSLYHYKPWERTCPTPTAITQVTKETPKVTPKAVKPTVKPKATESKDVKEWCTVVQEYVSKYGKDEVRKAAKERGYTGSQIKQLEKCIK